MNKPELKTTANRQAPRAVHKCEGCGGNGTVEVCYLGLSGGISPTQAETCDHCHGTGKTTGYGKVRTCRACGHGYRRESRMIMSHKLCHLCRSKGVK